MNDSKVTPVEAQAVPDQPVAWMSEDGRTISDKQKAALIADGGASATTMRAFSIPLVAASPAAADQSVYGVAWRNQFGVEIIVNPDDPRASKGTPVYTSMARSSL